MFLPPRPAPPLPTTLPPPPTLPADRLPDLPVGDSWEWDHAVDGYPPSDGWALAYTFDDDAGHVFEVLAATSSLGDYFEVRELASAHDGEEPATYTVTARVTRAGAAHRVYSALVRVVPASGSGLGEIHARLAALKAARSQVEAGGFAKVVIAGREVEYRNVADVNRAIATLENAIDFARREASGTTGMQIRFTR